MCGIAGYLSEERLNGRGMIESLRHRGPDRIGAYQAQVAGRQAYLGHTRLSIIDLSDAGRQPMSTADGRVTIVYNGEVYNFQELKARYLERYAFRSATDTEVLLYLYCELGPDFVTELNGDFAFALLDERIGRLFLYRDRLGVKPLYYYHREGTLAFASELKALIAAGLPLSLSEEILPKYFVFKYVPGNATLYREVERVPPGGRLDYDLFTGRLVVERYWTPRQDAAPRHAPYADLKAQLRDLLADAVRMRLVADVPVGTFFSGGLDSSIIAYLVREHPQITHYCARKTEKDLRREGTTSDYAHAQQLARRWTLSLKTVDIGSGETTLDHIRQTLYYADDLIADGSQIPSYLIAARAGRGATKVLLSGMGADELFYGYAGHLLVLLASYLDRLPAPAAGALAKRLGRLSQGRGAFKAYRRWLHRLGKYYSRPAYRHGLFGIVGDYENSLGVCTLGDESVQAYLDRYFAEDMDPFESLTRFELENFLVKNLHYLDRMCMAHGVEGRVPYMDHRLVEFALSLPRSRKLGGLGRTKKILKDAFVGVLPSHVLKRRKAGFGMPLRSIFSRGAKVGQLLDLDFFGGFDFFDQDHIRRVIRRHLSGVEDNAAIIYALISFQEWYRLFYLKEAIVESNGQAGKAVGDTARNLG